jgi:hypothetical protein
VHLLGTDRKRLTIPSSDIKSKLETLIETTKDNSAKLGQLYSQADRLQKEIDITSLSPSAQCQLETLLSLSEHVTDIINQGCILESLAFDGMYGRYEAVDDAHFDTFKWIYHSDSDSKTSSTSGGGSPVSSELKSGGDSETPQNNQKSPREERDEVSDKATRKSDREKKKVVVIDRQEDSANQENGMPIPSQLVDSPQLHAKVALRTWLAEGNGIFHISGKLGSGKSTLMKYLCDSDRTVNLLKQWAGKLS